MLDAGNKRVLVYDRNGVYLRTFGTAGTGPGKLGFDTRGLALDLDNDWVYVSDASDGTIEKFSLTGTPLGTFTVPGIDPGSVGGPREITVGLDHNLYVMDYSGERMLKFSPSGTILSETPEHPEPGPRRWVQPARGHRRRPDQWSGVRHRHVQPPDPAVLLHGCLPGQVGLPRPRHG